MSVLAATEVKSPHPCLIAFVGDDIVCSRGEKERWRTPLSAVKVIGELTNQSGPWGDDYLLALVTDENGSWFEASFYAEGANEFLVSLSTRLGDQLQWSLCNATEFRSRVMWPPQLAGSPMFEFREEGLLGRLGLSNKQYLHPGVISYVVANKPLEPTR